MNTNMTLEKRILSVLLTVIMVFSMVPLSVFAADGNQASVTVNKTETEYATIQEAFDAAKKLTEPCTVKVLRSFKGSMVLGVTFTAEDNCDITLDVNGFDMYNCNTRDQASASMFTFEKGTNAHLTVVNNSENRETLGGIFYYPNGTDISNSVFYMEGGTLTIEDVGGDGIKNKTSNYDKISGSIVYLDGGDVIINGSKFGEENNIVPLYVKSGNLTVNGGKFISQQGNALWIAEGFDGNVSLSGGRFSSTFTRSKTDEKGNFVQVYSIPSILREDGGKVDDLLAKGYVYQKNADDEKNSESALYREISVVPEPGVKYIAADGTEQSCTEYTELTESTIGSAGLTGWYVVKGTVNKEGLIGIAGGKTLNLILCEGATLNLQQTLYLMGGATLNIYGQNGGTGTLIVKGTAGVRQPGIGIMHGTAGGSASVNIYGGTVTAQTDNGAQPIGTNPELMPYGKVTVTIAKGLKCVKTDDQNTAYAYYNTDGTSITITKCTEHKWSYTNKTNDTHDQTCDLCGTAETGVAHTTARYQYIRADIHRLICACGKDYSTEYHMYTYTPNSDGLTHTATCKCEYSVDDIAHTYKGEDEICICGAVHSATYDGKKYASLQSAIDAAAPVGGTVTLARQVNENVVSTDGTVTIDLGGNRWSGYIDDWGSIVPLTVNGGSVTLKNGNLFQWWSSSSARTGIEINDGSVTIEEDVRVMGGIPEGDVLPPSITLNGGTLILKEGAVLLSGLQVPEGKVLADYLPEGTAFVKCSYDNSSDTVTVSDPQEFVSDVYSTNRSTEEMMIVSHTHDFGGGTACPCGFNCDHSVVDSATGKCENCGTQIYVASLVKADGTAENYDIFANAWTAAIESEGSTLKLLCNVEFDDNGADGLVLDHGKFTLDLGGFTLESFAYQQMLVISGTADIVIKNGVLLNTYNTEGGGQLFLSTGNAIDVKGGSLTLDGVTLHGAYEVKGTGEIQSYALELYSGNLAVKNCTFFGSLAVYKMSDESSPTVKITSATLHNGLIFTAMGEEKDYDGFSKSFADGSMLFDENGKYIDIRDDSYWLTDGGEGYGYATGFYYKNEAIVEPHTHTYENGICSECDYACPHDSGKNDREASYFEKAICSVCHAEYGNYAKDTNKPTGRIEIKERTWWESFIHAITFGLFYKEKVTVEITASDDSYSQAGYDETKHAVKIEYLISNTELSLETVKNSAFTEYKGEIDISDDSRYVVYARLNDFAGNEEYISTNGFVIDTTPPVIEVDADGQSKRYSNGQRAEVCGDTQINFIDDNFDTAYRTIDGEKDKIWSSPFLVAASDTDRTERWITFEVHDKAGNISTVEVYVHKEHSFDEETGVCAYCGYQAAVLIKCSNDNNEEEFVSGDGLDETMRKVDENKFDRFYLKLYGNVEKKAGVGTYGSTSKKWTFDLNGYTISNPPSVDPNPVAALFYVAGDITFVGNGAMNADVMVDGGQLTIDGECSFQKLEHKRGTLTVNAGSFESLIISKLDVNWSYTRETALCGGHYGEVKIVDIEGLTCADLLARGYRFEGLTLEQAKVTELKDATIVACDHADIGSDGICPDCGMEFFLSVEANGTTKLFETFESAIRYAEQNDGCTLKLLADVNEKVAVKAGEFTLDATDRKINGALNVAKGADLTVGGGEITGNVICAKGGKLTAFGTHFSGTINCVGEGALRNCKLAGAVTGKSSLKLNSCEIPGNLSISGNAEAEKCTVRGTVTVNNGGSLKSTGGTYKNTVNVKSGGTLEIVSGTFDKKLTAESGSKLIVSGGSYAEVGAENNVDFTLSGGEFTNITVNGQHLIDCLAEGKAFEDMNNSFIIDGRVGIAGDVKVVDHTHTCIWKTSTHEKLCGCGYVEAVDTEAPVISGIDPENNHYGSLEFTVTDANDFTVWMDDEEITLVNGKYTMEPDNETHLITATDIAGNTVSFRFGIFKTYHVTLPTGVGYIIHSRESTVRHGDSYDFIVEFNNGYSRTEDFKVLVNGNKLDELSSDRDSASFVVRDVSEDLVITVEGVADITAPEVEVSIRGNSFKEFLNRITFGLFFKQTQTVEVKAHDFGSGIKKVEYLLSETAFADKDAITGSWTELDLNDAFKAYFSIEPSQKTFVYVRVTDMSDNITVVNTDGMVVYTDAEAVTGAQTFTKTTDSDVVYKLNLNGNFVAKVYNGTEEIGAGSDYALLANGILMLKNSYLRTLAAGEYTIRLTIKPMGENYADNSGNDAPADVVMKLTVEKKAPTLDHTPSDGKIYDGKPIGKPTLNTDSDGALTFEYKRADEEDTAYTTEAPKNVGKYTIRITTAETDTFKSASSTMEFEIQPKEVTISDVKVADKTYDGSPDAKITEKGTFDGLINGDKVDIVTGKAAYDDKNVGNGKTVAFYDFALSGDDAANYVLAAQPANTTASISAKELTIADLKVKDKQYDGKNTAAIDGTPALVGVVDGDMLTLINGVPTFDSVKIGKDIAISFTAFTLSGDSVTVGNYTLTQPSGITANIVEYVATGDEYSVNSNDWINKDFVITAKAGYALSLTDTANGEWSNTLSAAGETGKGRLTFYVKNTATGVISAAVTENYKIDKTAPTGEVKLNERTAFQKFINTITFGLFFKDDVNVKLTAKDEASGVKSVMYFKSDRILTDEEVRAITDWTDNSDFDIEAKDMDKFVIYVRIEDNAGNVTLIGSDGATFDTTAPEIVGVENDKTYYVTKKIAIDDENLASVTLNGETVEDVFTLVGDKDATYVIRTEDKAGNVTEYTVYMKPISSITDAISAITADNVKSSDAETISSVERQILDIAEAFDDGESTEDEWNKLTAAAAKCKDLNKRIAEVADEITRLTDAVNGYDIDKVTSDDKADVEKLIADIDTLLDGDNLTDTERAALEALKGTARALLDRIAAAKDAAEADEITVIDGITKDNVKLGDKEALETAEKALEGALRDFEGNYTDEEQEDLETRLETVKAALAAIGNAEKAAEEIGKLPSADDAKLSDKSDLDRVKKLLEGLTENEKAMLDKDALGKVDALAEKIQKLAEEANSPKTGDTSNLALWIALLFISGGAVIGTTVVSKKQKHSAK